jgi:hypothetical protein
VAKQLVKHQVTIAQEIGRAGLIREGVHELLGRPGRGGCSVTLKWTTRGDGERAR